MMEENGLPKGWVETTLGEVVDIIMGQSPKGETCNENSIGMPLLNGPTEFGVISPIPIQYTTDPKKISNTYDLLFCVRGSTTGRMNWSNQKYAIGRGIAAIRHKNGIDYRKYVKAIIDYKLTNILTGATGSTFPNVSRNQLESTEILLPPLPEQKAIASILTSFDDKIELLQAQNETLETIAQTIFKEWFGKYHVGDELPEGWRVGKLGDVATHSKVSVRPFENPKVEYFHFSLPAYDDGLKPIVERGEMIKSNKYIVETNSFLVSKLNPFTPRIWTIFNSHDNFICSTEFQVVKPKSEKYFSLIHCLLNSDRFTNKLSQKIKGTSSSHQRVNPQDIFDVELVIPNDTDLNTFDSIVSPLVKKKDINKIQIQTLQATRDTLLPKLMSGQLRVAEFKEQICELM